MLHGLVFRSRRNTRCTSTAQKSVQNTSGEKPSQKTRCHKICLGGNICLLKVIVVAKDQDQDPNLLFRCALLWFPRTKAQKFSEVKIQYGFIVFIDHWVSVCLDFVYGIHLCCLHPMYGFQKKTQDATTSNCISGQKLKTKTMSLVRGKCDRSPSLQFAPWSLLLPPPVSISALAWLGWFNLKILPPKAKPHVIACHLSKSWGAPLLFQLHCYLQEHYKQKSYHTSTKYITTISIERYVLVQ